VSSGEISRFTTLFVVLRWATLFVAVVIGLLKGPVNSTLIAGAVLTVCALARTVRPTGMRHDGWRITSGLLAEMALGVAVVEATGYDGSPFLFTLCAVTIIAGFTGGLRILSGLAITAGLFVAIPTILLSPYQFASSQSTIAATVQLALLIVLVGGVAGYCRYLFDDARLVGQGLSAQVEHLTTMNDLFVDLHSAAEQVATPFDLAGAAKWAFDRLEAQFAPDVGAVLLRDPMTGYWRVAEATGLRLADDQPLTLPATLELAAEVDAPVFVADLRGGLCETSRWGLYCPMWAKDELLGMLAIESPTWGPTPSLDQRALRDLASASALAIGNALWLQRLHVLTVEQERARLARDLHDRISQSVVYLGLEVDRIADLNLGRAVQGDLLDLRGGLRTLVGELRDTLVELRSEVSEERDLPSLLRSSVQRVNRRGNIAANIRTDCNGRPPVVVERELWHIAQEAVTNAERHSRASRISVLWRCNQNGALLEVVDDGVGLPAADIDPTDSTAGYGLRGMRERADAIRAHLDIVSRPYGGTVVRAQWRPT
jgi:signal transduction histidine kinase